MIGPNSHSLHQHTPCLYTASMCSIYLVGASTLKVHFLLAPFPLKYFMCFPFTYFSGHYVPEIFHPLFTHKLLTHSSTVVDAFIHKLLHLPCWRTFYSRPFPSPLLRAFHPRAFPDSSPLETFHIFSPTFNSPPVCIQLQCEASNLLVQFLLAPLPRTYFTCFPSTYFSGRYVPSRLFSHFAQTNFHSKIYTV